MSKITKSVLHKANVIVSYLGKGVVWTGATITPTEIAIHNTGLWDVPAKNFHSSQKQNNLGTGREASWHFTVDDVAIYQHNPINWKAWHVGSAGNKVAIAIEICMFKDATRQKIAEDNAIALAKELMKMYNISLSKVKMHKDYTGKHCPQVIIDRDGNLEKFKNRIANFGQATSTPSAPSTPTTNTNQIGTVTCLVDALNLREKADFNSKIVGTITKGKSYKAYAKKNGLYNLGGNQWCSAGEKYVKFVQLPYVVGTLQKDVVTTTSLNVRSGRGADFTLLGTFPKDTIVNVWYIDKAKDGSLWGSCSINGKTGYINMNYTQRV